MNVLIRPYHGQVPLGTCYVIVGGSQGQRDLLFEKLDLEYEPANELVKDKERLKRLIRESPAKLLRFKYFYQLDVHYFLYNHRRGRLTYAMEVDDLDQVPWHYLKQARHLVVFALEYHKKFEKIPPAFPYDWILLQMFSKLKKHQWAGWRWGGEAFFLPHQTTVEQSRSG